jgi:Protein of unknown function (DUF2380)
MTPKRLIGPCLAASLALASALGRAADPVPIKIAVFDFELDDESAAGAAAKSHTLRACGGCDASIARDLGADQSLLGLVTRVANTEYYASVQLTDARTGKILRQRSAFFTGADDAWAAGVRMLLKHEILADDN